MYKIINLSCTSKLSYINELTNLYIEVFSAPPRNEIIDKDEISKMMTSDMDKGYIKVIFDQDEKIIGSTTVKPTSLFTDYKSLNLSPNSIYLSNIMLKESSRGLGLGRKLISAMIDSRQEQEIYSRCREDAKQIRQLLENSSFKLIHTYTTIMNKTSAKRLIYHLS